MNKNLANYDQHLSRSCRNLPAEAAHPQPSTMWPDGNIRLYEKYRAWLLEGGAGFFSASNFYMPIAGHILGLNTVPYQQMDLQKDFEKVLDFVQARGCSEYRFKIANLAMLKFRKFVRIELGLGEEPKFKPFDLAAHTRGLPVWLVSELERHQRNLQRNWRPARVMANLSSYWSKYGKMWSYFCQVQGVRQFADFKRAHILAFIDLLIEEKYANTTINCYLLYLRGFLCHLQQEGYSVPQALLRVRTLKKPDSLPKYLSDDQVMRLRDEFKTRVQTAGRTSLRRQALLNQAIFYLLWQGGLRVGEVEELRLEDLDFPDGRLTVRNSKGMKDRTIYLTPSVIGVMQAYLEVRGEGTGGQVFLYRNAPLNKSFIHSSLRAISEKAGVPVYPHRLRHTCGTQLLNAGCRITSIQQILGHENINTTMIYARVYNQTVAEDFYAAMERVEERLSVVPEMREEGKIEAKYDEVVKVPTAKMLDWLDLLSCPELGQNERLELAGKLKIALVRGRSFATHPHQATAPPI